MCPLVLLIATAAVGIEVGWEPLAEGGHEYTIQIEPQLLDVLKRGTDEIVSEVPPQVHISRLRVIGGTGTLPQVDGPAAGGEPTAAAEKPEEPSNEVNLAAPQTAEAAPGGAPAESAERQAAAAPAKLPPSGEPSPLGGATSRLRVARRRVGRAGGRCPKAAARTRSAPMDTAGRGGRAVVRLAGGELLFGLDRLGIPSPLPRGGGEAPLRAGSVASLNRSQPLACPERRLRDEYAPGNGGPSLALRARAVLKTPAAERPASR